MGQLGGSTPSTMASIAGKSPFGFQAAQQKPMLASTVTKPVGQDGLLGLPGPDQQGQGAFGTVVGPTQTLGQMAGGMQPAVPSNTLTGQFNQQRANAMSPVAPLKLGTSTFNPGAQSQTQARYNQSMAARGIRR